MAKWICVYMQSWREGGKNEKIERVEQKQSKEKNEIEKYEKKRWDVKDTP